MRIMRKICKLNLKIIIFYFQDVIYFYILYINLIIFFISVEHEFNIKNVLNFNFRKLEIKNDKDLSIKLYTEELLEKIKMG